ncbi:MAG: orotate phosphoribosyltransferase [Candidatus Hydrogenedentes bacterium]|nr:orotate phosphoribosyltransferase [Candidatus Hydrogenedentota bacterium]
MSQDFVIEAFKACGALLEGHFIYASGRHGRHFLQAARVLQFPVHTETLCRAMAEKFQDTPIDVVIGPATGGIILAYETARHVGCRSAFTEKDGEGGFALKRGFALKPGTRVLVVEDIVTTGGSVKETIAHLRGRGAEIVGVSVLIDRSGGKAEFDCEYRPLCHFTLESWPADEVPAALQAIPVTEPDDLINAGIAP